MVTTPELGLQDARDEDQFLTAVQQGRIFISHNYAHFILLHHAWIRWSRAYPALPPHPGIIVAAQGPAWPAARLALTIHLLVEAGHPQPNDLWRLRRNGTWLRE